MSVTPRPLFTPGKDPVPIVQEAGWVPGQVWTGAEKSHPPPGFDHRTVQPVASRYTNYATRKLLWQTRRIFLLDNPTIQTAASVKIIHDNKGSPSLVTLQCVGENYYNLNQQMQTTVFAVTIILCKTTNSYKFRSFSSAHHREYNNCIKYLLDVLLSCMQTNYWKFFGAKHV